MIIKPEECLGEIDLSFYIFMQMFDTGILRTCRTQEAPGITSLIQYIMACSVEKHAQP